MGRLARSSNRNLERTIRHLTWGGEATSLSVLQKKKMVANGGLLPRGLGLMRILGLHLLVSCPRWRDCGLVCLDFNKNISEL